MKMKAISYSPIKREPNNMKKDRKITCFKIAQNSIYFFALFILVLILLFQVSDSKGYNWNVPRSHLDPWLFWSPRNLGPLKVGSCFKMLQNDFHAWTKFFGAQTSQGPNFLGTKKARGPNEVGDHFSYDHCIVRIVIVAKFCVSKF